MKPPLNHVLIKLLKALHSGTALHHDNTLHDFLLVLPNKLQSKKEQQLEMLEDVGLLALHQLHVVGG
jgi:hypothetical protein